MAELLPSSAPRATYRLQFHKDFTFRDALDIVDYLADLGVSHVYASPFMMARPGSNHGYDIVDHNLLNPEIGTDEDLDALVEALHARGLGMILDIVPNHMGIGSGNPWWMDVLEWGEASPYARFFDIDWDAPRRNLTGKVLLPVLGNQYGVVLEAGDLRLRFDPATGTLSVWYYEHRFPVAAWDYDRVLRPAVVQLREPFADRLAGILAGFAVLGGKRRSLDMAARATAEQLKRDLAELAAEPGVADILEGVVEALHGDPNNPESWQPLHRLIELQAYRPAYWRVATDEINYRRFFNINDLAGLRIELRDLFEETHRKVFRLLEDGKIDGLRVDHIDGLFDPQEYCERLQARAGRPGQYCYVVVEKILAHYEDLPDAWPVAGTTGYDTLNLINGLFVDPKGERPLDLLYRRFTRRTQPFDEVSYESKLRILRVNLASEVRVLAHDIHRLSSGHWLSRDFTLEAMANAIQEVIARFPVYRTYVDANGASATDRRYIDWAIGIAKKRSPATDTSIFDFLQRVLTGDLAVEPTPYQGSEVLRLAMKFQQLSGPAMAKGLEDTSFYRYVRLISLNEVGGDPRRFGVSPAAFHHVNEQRLRRHPFDMLATSTHDTKRGEDARARINLLSGPGSLWGQRIRLWERLNRRHRGELDAAPVPDRNDEYYFYQTMVGVWPLGLAPDDGLGVAALLARVEPALVKALREGKEKSSWANPDEAYEAGVAGFARRLLGGARPNAFLTDFAGFMATIGRMAALNSLAQTLLRLTMPGVPDTYQGAELWELSLVDPDNRRPVDFAYRREVLATIRAAFAEGRDYRQAVATLSGEWQDGREKLFVIWAALNLRKARPALFAQGDYTPLAATGERADHVIAFARGGGAGGGAAITVVPRLVPGLMPGSSQADDRLDWGDTGLPLGAGLYRDVLTGVTIAARDDIVVPVAELLADFPVALLTRDD
ncbi:MAG TPA: malto-oligosyltrehalose synthase [Stellaceae bacterium]|nr:malto-oligosyltrehalose synthase [Stellaceae bacterium]